VGVQVRWDKGGTEAAGDYTFFHGNGNADHHLGTGFFVHKTMDQNCIYEGIRSRLNSGNACCHAVQNLLSSHLLSANVKIKIHKTIILPVVLYGVKPGLSR
jgi:hypothetical protein